MEERSRVKGFLQRPLRLRLHAGDDSSYTCMDTLVIQLELGQSRLRTALEAATAECRDFVEWIHV